MPIIKSAIKRVRQTKSRTARNATVKRQYRELTKQFLNLVGTKKIEEAAKLFPELQKAIDMVTKRNLLHKNNAARKKSRFAKMISTKNTPPAKVASPKKSVEKKKSTPVKKEEEKTEK